MKRNEAYNILGVTPNSDEKELKKAYKKLVAEKHPDKHKNNPDAEKEFKSINEAYEIATNKIPAEDDRPQNPFMNQGSAARSPFDPWGAMGDFFTVEQFFSQNPFPQNPFNRQKASLQDLEVVITIDLKTAALGGSKEISYLYNDLCSKCSVSGFVKDGSTCTRCNGSGRIQNKQFINGFVQVTQQVCTGCNGSGGRVRCNSCNGAGYNQKRNTLKVKIPPIYNNSILKVAGKGHTYDNKASDLYVKISIETVGKGDLEGYSLQYNNIQTTHKLKIGDLLAGTELDVKHIDGTTTRVIVPSNSKIGDKLYVYGKGVKDTNGQHVAVLDILYPNKNITQQIKEQLDSLYG